MKPTAGTSLPDLVHFGREICGDLEQAERREWWLSNGLGAYASGTIAGSLTRRYHGLLIAPVNPPLGRFLVVAKTDATLIDGDREWPLFTNRWGGGTVNPQGYRHIESFRLEGRMPVWRFAVGDAIVEQRIWMEPGANTTCLAWCIEPLLPDDRRARQLRVKLLVNARDHHGNAKPWDFNPVIEFERNRLKISHPNWFQAYLHLATGTLRTEHTWYENFDLAEERARGLDANDSHLCVGEASFDLTPGHWAGLVASLDENASPYLLESMRRFAAHDQGVLKRAQIRHVELLEAPAWVSQLVLAADSFVFARPLPDVPGGESVIAGFPWFGDWGRDTMIALPGLTLTTGRYETAHRVLETFARFIDRGMLPNVFPGAGAHPDYNTVDAALWYIEAWRAYFEATGNHIALSQAFPVLASIIDCYWRGTRYGIQLDDSDGLLFAGEPGVQITWMDAKIGDWVVTPRIGKPVEINALWYNALCSMAAFAKTLEQDAGIYEQLAEQTRHGFARFVRPQGGLLDVLDGPNGDDPSIRPNQIFAVSLAHSPLQPADQARIVEECARELLGSYGLRSLTSAHADYRPRYEGGVVDRDSAYHQGALWAWLLGHFALALYRVGGNPREAQRVLEPLGDHLMDAGLGTVSEIFDGDPPHTPRGAPAQAWSVACVLEAWWRLERARRSAEADCEDRAIARAVI
ncbi:MAG: amylo-alpha-1,6-glucosidase [Methylococcales bacterium]